ncbi:DNA polymerase III subunit gamma/tau [Candidatus Saccharibacteria bacterium]|nr:DNA polymerase III subunit gamma/tau [Candidatus Saccharibacteria bacterium]
MSLVLYRKYRPKKLEEIVAQAPIVKTLSAALEKGLPGHALLLTGPRGVGKTSLARILAHRINGVEYKLDETPLDIIEIDAASSGRIDEVRDLREKVKLAPLQLKYKVYIIDEVHMLTKEAFNALLKTLEEPPEHAVFILATTEAHKVPATIASRCQHFAFKAVPVEELRRHLENIAKQEKVDIDEAALQLLAQHAGGSLRDALSLLDQLTSLDKKIDGGLVEEILGLPPTEMVAGLLESLAVGNLKGVVERYRKIEALGVDPVVLAERLTSGLRDGLQANPHDEYYGRKLDLLEDLLDVFGARQPHAALEIALLKHSRPAKERGNAD